MNFQKVSKSLLIVMLMLVSVFYLLRGFHELFPAKQDLQRRWIECRFVIHGQDPFQIHLNHMQGPDPDFNQRECDRLTRLYGIPDEPVYPAWSYAPAILFVWPSYGLLPYYFALINIVGIAVLVTGAVNLARPITRLDTVAVAVSAIAVAAIGSTLVNGNFGIIVVACLMISLWCNERGRPIASGIFFWIAMLKPTIALPFAIVFLLRLRWKPLAVAGTLILLGCLLPWILDRVNPVEMTREAIVSSRDFQFGGYGPVNWLGRLGVPRGLMTPLAAGIVMGPLFLLLIVKRNMPLWQNLALISVAGRLWAYHLAHDNVMLIFLLAALWRIFFNRPGLPSVAALLIVGASLWMPSRLAMHESIGSAHILIWIAGAIYVAGQKSHSALDVNARSRALA